MTKDLLSKLSAQNAIISKSKFFDEPDYVTTDFPALNVAMSGKIDGGLVSGLTVVAGESRTFKSCMCLNYVSAYLNKYPDGICLFYDSEFGTPEDYLRSFNIDVDRVVHIPIEHVEQLKFDLVSKLEKIEKGDRVIVFVDSIGNVASKKELDDAVDEKAVADMSRARAIKSFFRIITPKLKLKDIPCLAVAHVYKEMGLFPKTIISGGSGIMYSANTAFVITKAQDKKGTDLKGFKFTINIEKSRFVNEKAKIPLNVSFDEGIYKHSGMLDWALESGHIVKPSNGWYSEKGSDAKVREADTPSLLEKLIDDSDFAGFVEQKYKLGAKQLNKKSVDIEESEE
jgi:hypothetical protein